MSVSLDRLRGIERFDDCMPFVVHLWWDRRLDGGPVTFMLASPVRLIVCNALGSWEDYGNPQV